MIEVRFHPKVRGISAAFVRKAVSAALKAEKAAGRPMSVYVTTNADIRRINKRFLKHDYATDVISFDLGSVGNGPDRSLQGELIVSADFARDYAKKNGISFREEVSRYFVHGTLHLLGYDDRKRADYVKMHKRQEQIIMSLRGARRATKQSLCPKIASLRSQ